MYNFRSVDYWYWHNIEFFSFRKNPLFKYPTGSFTSFAREINNSITFCDRTGIVTCCEQRWAIIYNNYRFSIERWFFLRILRIIPALKQRFCYTLKPIWIEKSININKYANTSKVNPIKIKASLSNYRCSLLYVRLLLPWRYLSILTPQN